MRSPALVHTNQELVIGLAAPIGSNLELVCATIVEALTRVRYSAHVVQLSSLLDNLKLPKGQDWPKLIKAPEFDRYNSYMDAGNAFRKIMDRGDALAMLAVGAMLSHRAESRESPGGIPGRRAYILRSLKHPDEVATLRRIYGPAFVLFSVCSPPSARLQTLASRLAESLHQFQSRTAYPQAHTLILRDESEADSFGQNVRKAFPQGDFFVNARSAQQVAEATRRSIELLFGNIFHTPSRDEYAMFHAQAAAVRSASLQRQVGAVIATGDGDIVAVGANEVPKPGGGLYWSGDSPDYRDFVLGYETNDILKHRMLADVINRLKTSGFLAHELSNLDTNTVVSRIMHLGAMRDAQVLNVIEFGRCVHAEMAAIVDAARRGSEVQGGTVYSSTFPCHECARHIVAAGIRRVVYIEPYPKSLVNELYPDSIEIDPDSEDATHVSFQPFVGVSPRRYLDLFSIGGLDRKDRLGKIVKWDREVAKPRLGEYSFRTEMINELVEKNEFAVFSEELKAAGFV